MNTFVLLEIRPGLLLDLAPIQVWGWLENALLLPADATCYGMVTTGQAQLRDLEAGRFDLCRGMFFTVPNVSSVQGGSGLVIVLAGYRGLRQIGGPLEATGRLRYIDGCSDTLLICPPRWGEPCLNHLHIPPHTDQTPHTHPSVRIGVIMGGTGECRTPDGVYPLQPGIGWYIPTGYQHSFFTQDEALDVVAWHPDSDFGPHDEDHPMINRTIIE
ncbi:MAG: cupin domain-containing protein [Candidatus Competibacteraceae bacterium]|nr:cupin domain-containing protein [Candidatus Competibacteraceae bacterium]MCP5124948.1 cupin domain-containing protein [Gammaproteobacteria bacterium]HRX69895.1 cupin domain-containing protein [Candidatus Competibacteraceae bacterium]